jgi:Domain of unknown function (DUF4440)
MPQTSELAKGTLKDLITIERTLWENNADTYHDSYSPEALLIFAGVGRIDRETAVAAIRKENAEGRAWAEVSFDEVDGRWITTDAAALISYMATARWNYESSASRTLCASVYLREGGSWRVAFHQQTPI